MLQKFIRFLRVSSRRQSKSESALALLCEEFRLKVMIYQHKLKLHQHNQKLTVSARNSQKPLPGKRTLVSDSLLQLGLSSILEIWKPKTWVVHSPYVEMSDQMSQTTAQLHYLLLAYCTKSKFHSGGKEIWKQETHFRFWLFIIIYACICVCMYVCTLYMCTYIFNYQQIHQQTHKLKQEKHKTTEGGISIGRRVEAYQGFSIGMVLQLGTLTEQPCYIQ